MLEMKSVVVDLTKKNKHHLFLNVNAVTVNK
jgi:hypothetical protein